MSRRINITASFLLKFVISAIFLFAIPGVSAQEDPEKAARQSQSLMSDAREALEEEDFASAEAYYREAISKDPSNAAARYNLGTVYHNEDLTGEALERDSQAAEIAEEKPLKHKSFHNKGNAFMKQKKYPEAIEAYKDALRNNPNDEETRYNLALAKKMWEKEKQDGGGDDSENKEGDQENEQQENKDQKDQQGDQGEQEQDQQGDPKDQEGGEQQDEQKQDPKKEGEGEQQKQDQGEGEKPQDQQQKQQQQQQQPVPGQLSPQQIKSLLEAMGNEEKKVQEKMNAEKVQGVPTRAEKDW